MQLFLLVLGFALSFLSTGLYISSMLKGKTKPHLYSNLIWSIVTIIAFLGSLVAGGGNGAWQVGLTGFLGLIIFVLCFKYGTKDIKPIDKIFLAGALISIIPWILLKDPLWSVILATIIDFCAYLPTIRKTWKNPDSEMAWPWAIGSIRFAIAIITLGTFNLTTIIFPAEIFIMNSVVVYIILSRRKTN